MAALKPVYQAPDLAAAERALDQLEVAWGPKYPHIIRSWRKHWDHLSVYFDFPLEIRRIIYTTNTIESFNSVVRKFTRNRLVFPHEDAVRKVVCLAIHQLSKQWINRSGTGNRSWSSPPLNTRII